MNIFTNISRLVVGSLFIVSGLIKANDPVGFSYKLKDYFAPDVLNLEFLVPFVLPMAVLICAVEIVLGVAALFGSKMKLVSWMLLLMIIFFTFLTFYSAYFEKVTDCGCFGDALKLTPWESFSKDLVLLVFVLIIFIRKGSIALNTSKEDMQLLPTSIVLIAIFSYGVISWGFPVYFSISLFALVWFLKNKEQLREKITWVTFGIPALVSLLFSAYVLMHLPIRDFRPYAIGKNLREDIKSCVELGKQCPKSLTFYTLKHKETGEIKEMDSDAYVSTEIWKDKSWEIQGDLTTSREVEAGYTSPIHDFTMTSLEDGIDITEDVLNDPNYTFLLIAYDIENKNNNAVSAQVNALAEKSMTNQMRFIGLTSSLYENVETFRHEVQAGYDYYTTDEKTLQTILRSNPGLMLLHDGVVIGKWHHNDIPEYSEIESLISGS
ncbi:MAG: DoxX family protein [Flavobacteriales bacterium]|nr:DoxX family protein [Flavobacteriales bacterium]